VGSRDIQAGSEHCSAICCMQAAKDAIITQEHLPKAKTTIFTMDIRAYGKGFDQFIDKARNRHDTTFINGRIASVESDPKTNDLFIRYITQDGKIIDDTFDLLVLSVGLKPSAASMDTARRLDVGLDKSGFVSINTLEPVTTNQAGILPAEAFPDPKTFPNRSWRRAARRRRRPRQWENSRSGR